MLVGWTDLRIEEMGSCDDDGQDYYTYDTLVGTSPKGNEKRRVPDFYGSTDACLDVLPADAIVRVGDTWAEIEIPTAGWPLEFTGSGTTRAEAVANALESWATWRQETR